MRLVTETFVDEISSIVFSNRHFKGKRNPFVKNEEKFTKNLRKKQIFSLVQILRY